MPKASHSATRVPHRGPRHDADPDRRVKYDLRFAQFGDFVEPQTVVVRRHRRTGGRELAPTAEQRVVRDERRRDRRAAKQAAEHDRTLANAGGIELL